jgi:hypothetical protein
VADPLNLIDAMAAWAKGRITVYAEAGKTTMQHVADGTYNGDELAKDLGAAVKRLSDDVTTFLAVLPTSDDGTT